MNQSLTKTGREPRLESFLWGSMTWLLDAESCAGAELSLARMTLEPGRAAPRHRHPDCQEALHLLSGKVELRVGGESRLLEAGESALIPEGAAHDLRNPGGRPAVLMIAYGSGTRRYEALASCGGS